MQSNVTLGTLVWTFTLMYVALMLFIASYDYLSYSLSKSLVLVRREQFF